jgi:hypothetical protein
MYFLLGVVFMATFQLMTRCNKDEDFLKNTISKGEQKQNIDYKAIKEAVGQFENAFIAGDQQQVNELTFDETVSFLSQNPQYSSQELGEIGKAMAKAKVSAASENFAEYSYIIEGHEFTFTMGLDSDGQWKLIRY